jgi:hypothetical protein
MMHLKFLEYQEQAKPQINRWKEIIKMRTDSNEMEPSAYNASYSGGRDHEDRGLKPACVNSSQDPTLKKFFTKKGWLKV